MRWPRALAGMAVLGGLLYPMLVYIGLQRISPRWMAAGIACIWILHLARRREGRVNRWMVWGLPGIGLVLCLLSAFSDRSDFMLLMPVVMSGLLFGGFGWTLWHPPSMAEVFARMAAPALSGEEVAYCRRVTMVWTGFFLLNGALAWITARYTSVYWWGLYNGLVSYLLIGGLFAVEMTYRHWKFRRYVGLPTDPLFRRLFPPCPSPEDHDHAG